MARQFCLITHPNVEISASIPVTRWRLSELGRSRMQAGLVQPWMRDVTAIYCSTERKAVDTAAIMADHLSLPFRELAELGENDRSATGFLPPQEFGAVADEFFARPFESVRGWESAAKAQDRIVNAVLRIAAAEQSTGIVAIVAHGAVGTLLYCFLAGTPISRRWDQPANGGGNYFRFTLKPAVAESWWRAIDADVS